MTSLSLVLGATAVFAGNPGKIGMSGASYLRIPVGARGAALGGSGVANLSGLESIHFNPAGLSKIKKMEVMFFHMKYLADMDMNYGGIAFSMGDYGNAAFTAQGLNIGKIKETREDAPENFTGRTLNPTIAIIGLNYGLDITDQVSVGASVNYINEPLGEASASTVAFSLGVQYTHLWKGLNIGVAFKNFGPDLTYEGNGALEYVNLPSQEENSVAVPTTVQFEPAELPTYFQLGVGYNHYIDENNTLNFEADFRNNGFSSDEFLFGAEYVFQNMLALRGGYAYSTQDDYIFGATIGAGLMYQQFGIDYAWRQTTDYFDHQHLFTFTFDF